MAPQINPDLILQIFVFGVKVAEHIHGIRRTGENLDKTDEIFDTVRAIVSGDLTLLPTPEEAFAALPKPPEPFRLKMEAEFYEMMRNSRDNEKLVAEMVAETLPK